MTAKPTSRTEWLLLTAILLLGAAIRLFYLSEIASWPDFTHPGIDAAYHDFWARGLARGEWDPAIPLNRHDILGRPFFRPPGYPYFLALVYLLPGRGYLAARLVQFALGLASVFLAYAAARRWKGPAAGLIAAAFCAFYWVFIYFEGELLDPSLSVFLILMAANLLLSWRERLSPSLSAASGLALGALILVRANAALLAPVIFAWMAWASRREGAGRRGLRHSLLFLGVSALALLPATIRNYRVSGDFVPVSANSGMSLAIGNNDLADGSNHYLPGYGRFGSPFEYPEAVRSLEGKKGRSLSYAEADRGYRILAGRWIRENPGRFLALTLRKTAYFWGPAEVTNNKEISFARRESRALSLLPGDFSLLLALFLSSGGYFFIRRICRRGPASPAARFGVSPPAALFLAVVAVYFLSMLPFVAAARYRIPVIPFMMIVGAGGLADVAASREKILGRLFSYAAAAAALYFLVSREAVEYRPSAAKWHFDRAVALDRGGDPAAAKDSYRRSLAEDPGYDPAILNLAAVVLRRGETGEAVELYRRYLELNPDRARARANLAEALSRAGRLEEAEDQFRRAAETDPDDFYVLSGIGRYYSRRGEWELALPSFRRQAELNPFSGRARTNLALVLWESGRIEEALEEFRRAAEYSPSNAEFQVNLANALAARGDYGEAEAVYRRAIDLDPAGVLAYYNLGVALEKAGRPEDALAEYQRALRVDPGHVSTRYNLALILLELGRREEARRQIEAAARLAPEDVRIKALLERMGP